jgi:phosphoenolpyruvate synthase/pyruvate phosphate dikinase
MSALITQSRGGYKGKFLDGAAGKGLDVVSGTVTQDTVVVGLNRAKLNGAMIARVRDDKTMNVTVSVKVEDRMVPVIGLTLTRQIDEMTVGSVE